MKSSVAMILFVSVLLVGCDRVGSKAWCAKQDKKPKSEWTMEEAGDYTRFCLLGMDSEKMCKELEEKPKGDWTASEAADYAKNCLTGRNE